MDTHNPIDPETPVSELMERFPQTIPVFLRHRMACVGCSMNQFETVGSAAQIYGLESGALIGELHAAIQGED